MKTKLGRKLERRKTALLKTIWTPTKKCMAMMNNCTHTRMLEFLCALLDLILGTSICDHHQHLRDVPPHAAV